ncbi:heat shock protein HspQ [soil metagenome]
MDTSIPTARFQLGQVVRHRIYPFRGVIFDVDPVFANTDEWWDSIPEAIRPRKDQPFYHLLAENAESCYTAYVSEQNLLPDETGEPVGHPQAKVMFDHFEEGRYTPKSGLAH